MRRKRPPLGLIVLAATAVILGYLLTHPASLAAGPLGPPPVNLVTECLPANVGQADTHGMDSFTNKSHDVLVIDHVGLASARNMRIVGAYIVPGTGQVGEWRGFPPPAAQLDKDVRWAKREPAAGARVSPGETVNVVVGLEPTGRATASAKGIELLYHDGGTQYELVSNVTVIIKVSPGKCF